MESIPRSFDDSTAYMVILIVSHLADNEDAMAVSREFGIPLADVQCVMRMAEAVHEALKSAGGA